MAWLVCRYIFVFVGLSRFSVNLSVPRDNIIYIYKQPYGHKMCESLCQSISGCSNFEYSYDSLSCRVTSGPTSTGSDDVERAATSEGLQPMRKSCPQHSRILTTRKGHNVCVRDKNSHISTIGKYNNDKTRVILNMTTSGVFYYLSDYGFPTIGRNSVVMSFDVPQNVIIRFSQEYNLTDADVRMIKLYTKNKPYKAGINFCIGVPPGKKTLRCKLKFKQGGPLYDRDDYDDDTLIIWLEWDQTGYLSIGTGMTCGVNRRVWYQGDSTLLVNYITMKYRHLENPVEATITACNKHTNTEKEKRVQVKR